MSNGRVELLKQEASMGYPKGDKEFEDRRIKTVRAGQGGWSITQDNGWSFFIKEEKETPVPHVGDSIRFYGKGNGYSVRGVFINGEKVFYRTVAEQQKQHEEEVAANKKEERRKWEETAADRAAKEDKMPEVFQKRLEGFRARRPATFWERERYEFFCCSEAVKIAEALKTSEAVSAFLKLKYEEQEKLIPGLDGEHSGNTFGAACNLAVRYLQDPSTVPMQHAAICPLLGCQECGCYSTVAKAG